MPENVVTGCIFLCEVICAFEEVDQPIVLDSTVSCAVVIPVLVG